MKLFIIIPTFNRKDHLERLLERLAECRAERAEVSTVVVVDGSTDGTFEMLAERFPLVHIIRGTGDWWWTRSVNEGCKYAVDQKANGVLLMNDDTEINANYLDVIARQAEENPGTVIGSLNISDETAPRIYFSGVPRIQWWCAKSFRYHPQFSAYDPGMTGLHPSVILMGRGLYIPSSVFETIGFFDDAGLPQYKADLDFVLTANGRGIPTVVSYDAVVLADLSTTGGGATYTPQSFPVFLASFFRPNTYTNLIHSFRYYRKHCPWYILPISYPVDKFRLIYSYWKKRINQKEPSKSSTTK